MRVVDLAQELEIAPSEVLQACQRLGIDAAWAGAELGRGDVVVLRAEMATGDGPLDLTEPPAPAGAEATDPEPPAPAAEVAEPEVGAPEVAAAGVPAVEVAEPEVAALEVAEAAVVPAVEATEPEVAAPAVAEAGVPAVEVAEPAVPAAGAEAPEVVAPEVVAPAAAAPVHGADPGAPEPESEPEPAGEAASVPAADPSVGPGSSGDGGGAEIPPTAVGSRPDLVAEITPEAEPAGPLGAASKGGLPAGASAAGAQHPPAPPRRRFDRGLRNGLATLALAIVLAVISNSLSNPWPIAALWLVAALLLVSALVSAGRSWYRASAHPERIRGQWLAIVLLLATAATAVGLGTATWVVMRARPAAGAPVKLGTLNSVDHLRWGYKRLTLVAGTGWQLPAKDKGTCWSDETALGGTAHRRRSQRVEVGQVEVDCDTRHIGQVLDVWGVNRVPDAPYPGVARLQALARPRCQQALAAIHLKPGASLQGVALTVEYPTAKGWTDGDHDLDCLARSTRNTELGR